MRPDEVTPELLSSWLKADGSVPSASVRGVRVVSSSSTETSHTAVFDLDLAPESQALVPGSLFFKSAVGSTAEVEHCIYRKLSSEDAGMALPRCFAAGFDPTTDSYYLLLEDLSQSHVVVPYMDDVDWYRSEYTPTVAQQIVDSFAAVHAYFWGNLSVSHALEIRSTDLIHDEGDIRGGFDFSGDRLEGFLRTSDGRLSQRHRDLFRRVSITYPSKLVDRILTHEHLTLAHRDPHTMNVLVPRSPDHRPVIIDWATAGLWVGAHDLASHIVPFWFRSVRNAMERGLIERYHQKLCEHGVSGYSWDDCWADYRLGVIGQVNQRLKNQFLDSVAGLWICDNCISAFEDLGCAELL